MNIFKMYRRWRIRCRLHSVLKEVIREYHLQVGGMEPEKIKSYTGIDAIEDNGFGLGGCVSYGPFLFLFNANCFYIMATKEGIAYDLKKIVEVFTYGSLSQLYLNPDLTFIDEPGPSWDELEAISYRMQRGFRELKSLQRMEADKLYHKLSTPSR